MTFHKLWLSTLIVTACVGTVSAQNSIRDIQAASGTTFSGKPDSLRQGWTVGGLVAITTSDISQQQQLGRGRAGLYHVPQYVRQLLGVL